MADFYVRPIQDPYYGRGFCPQMVTRNRVWGISSTIGFTDSIVGFSLKVSPPFSYTALNEGDDHEYQSDLKTIGISVSFAWIKITFELETYTHNL